MPSKRTGKTAQPNSQSRASRQWLAFGIIAVAVALAIGVFVARSRHRGGDGSAESTSSALAKKVILPAIPRRPRPYILNPDNFNEPSVRRSYEIARSNPELLERMPCYCGCYMNPGHTNNLDCFVDKHGET